MNNDSTRAVAAIPGYLAGTWKADPAHSEIAFSVRQLLITTVSGRFTRHDVTVVTGEDPLASSVTATIDLASLDTGNDRRDEHVRSNTFLDVAEHPTASYRSTGIRHTGDGWIIDGDLTVHGVTRNAPLAVTATRFGPDPNGDQRAGLTATTQISRGEFGIDRWTGGGAVVSDKIAISLEIEAVLQP
ncbi:MAG TPA: YceI family protein [Mycobacterium sp.]|jgi:polyisoprenoid-binding protein YceI|nr:YceI family protein [Mycobacterium sp.]